MSAGTLTHLTEAGPRWTAERLRALDWRFLLPTPTGGTFAHLVILGGAPSVAADAVDLGIARHVSCEPRGAPVADAVVCLRAAVDLIDGAIQSVAQGGAFYAETGRGVHGAAGPLALGLTLRNAGFTVTGLYWCRPDFARREAYVPLDHPGALRWYMAALHSTSTPRAMVRRAVVHALARDGRSRFQSLLACSAVTAVAGPPSAGRPPSVLGCATGLSDVDRRTVLPLVLTPRNRRVVMLPFAPGADRPLAAVKVSRTPSRNEITTNEQRVLTRLRAQLDCDTAASIPRSLGSAAWGELIVGTESVVGGSPLSVAMHAWPATRARHVRDIEVVAAWLSSFHRRTASRRLPWGSSVAALTLSDTLTSYQRCFGSTPEEDALFAEIMRRSAALAEMPLATVWEHADFTPSNVSRSAGGVAVFDWAGGREGLPLVDLLNFATSWIREVGHRQHDLERFRALYLGPDDRLTRAALGAVTRYLDALSIDERFVPVLAVRLWCELATYTDTRRRESDRGGAAAGQGNVYARYVRAIAHDSERFFIRWSRNDVTRRASSMVEGVSSA